MQLYHPLASDLCFLLNYSRRKAVRFEKINLGDKIDLDLLEKRAVKDDEDAADTKKADSTKVIRKKVSLQRLLAGNGGKGLAHGAGIADRERRH